MPPRYSKLASVYFFYFSILGIYFPYWNLYLSDLNFSPEAIGQLMAVILVSQIFVPYWWSWVGDAFFSRIQLIRFIAVALPLFFGLTIWFDSYLSLLLILLVFGIFWHGFLPQIEAITLHSLGHQSQHYSTIRLWGAVGFIVMVVAVAPLVSHYGTRLIPVLISSSLLALAVTSFLIRARRVYPTPPLSIKPFLKRPEVLALLLVCFLMQFSHGPYYTFFSIYLRDHGYSDAWIGQIWALGVVAEVIILLFMYRLLPRWGAPMLLLASIIATAGRWVLLAFFPDSAAMVVVVQVLHALTVGLYHAAAINLLHFFFIQGVRGRGQALYSSVSFGAGGALGVYLSGVLWERIGGAEVFLLASVVALLAAPLIWTIYRGICRY